MYAVLKTFCLFLTFVFYALILCFVSFLISRLHVAWGFYHSNTDLPHINYVYIQLSSTTDMPVLSTHYLFLRKLNERKTI